MTKTQRLLGCIIIASAQLTACGSFATGNSGGQTEEDLSTRTIGTVVEDSSIESKANTKLKQANDKLRLANIQVRSFNRVVLLTGQVPDEETKILAGEVVSSIRHVRRLHNELEIGQNNTFSNNMHDSFLETKVVARLIATKGIESGSFEKIVTNGKLYLMGLVTQKEAVRIVNSAKEVEGLKQIVKVFEYIEAEPESGSDTETEAE